MTKLKLRRTWFQVHKWIGLILAILIIPLSLSGSALVWHEPVDRLLNPARYAVSGADLLAPGAYLAAAQAALKPGERIAGMTFPNGDGPVVLTASKPAKPGSAPRAGPPARTMVYLDPPTAHVLDTAESNVGLMRTVHMLHGSLLMPGVGRPIVGWIGVAMTFSCFTGLWLWWPTVGKWARGLRWKRHRNLDTNLHHLAGFWIALPLFVLSLTGAWISFPAFFGQFSGSPARQGGLARGALGRAQPLARPLMPLNQVIAAAQEKAPGALRSIDWPTDRKVAWTVTLAPPRGAAQEVFVDDSGVGVHASPVRLHGGPGLAGAMRRLHDGDDMGIVWQIIVFLGGILPALLAITGIIMWWRARSWREALAERMRADQLAAE